MHQQEYKHSCAFIQPSPAHSSNIGSLTQCNVSKESKSLPLLCAPNTNSLWLAVGQGTANVYITVTLVSVVSSEHREALGRKQEEKGAEELEEL